MKKEKKIKRLKSGFIFSSIRFKLISIISAIIVLSLSSMIFLATYFFKTDNEIRVQENNHKISEIIALNVKSDFSAIIEKSKVITRVILQETRDDAMEFYSKLFLNNDKDFIFIGIASGEEKGQILNFDRSIYNTDLMKESQISEDNIKTVNITHGRVFARSFKEQTIIHNVSEGFRMPVLGISTPFQKGSRGDVKSILVTYIKLNRFLRAFKTSGITEVILVNHRGDIIAHPDSKIVLSGDNYINLPIVKMMIKSKINNGQTRYEDDRGIYYLGSFKKIGLGGCGVIATVEEEKALEEVYNIQRRNLYLMVIVLTIVILIIFFFGRTLTRPIISLVHATQKIKEGEYNVEIVPAARDEIGELTNSFIEMGKGLEERERIKSAFGKFVNKEIADLVMSGEIQLGGEQKIAAVLFTDIRSFTSISSNLNPEEVVDFLNEYMTRMVKCINKTNGIVDKYIGDSIMAEWGVPFSTGNDTENAINAALLMRESLIRFNVDRGSPKKPTIKMGCGINTGLVLAGQIGSEDRMEYTVIGDTVNVASRIESLNKEFITDILISEDSYNMVNGIFEVKVMAPITIYGKTEPQKIYAVLGRMDDPDRIKTIQELRKFLKIERVRYNRRKEDR